MNGYAYAGVFIASLAISAIFVNASRRIAFRVGALDHPDSERKVQSSPIPRLGGIAVAMSLAVVWITASLVFVGVDSVGAIVGIMGPAVLIAYLGLIDDRHNLNPWIRLFAQMVIAASAWVGGTRIYLTSNTFFDAAIFILWVLVIVNAVNLLDNSDGLAGATVFVASFASAWIALIFGQILVSALGFALAGVAVGFLWHNWFPAKVYLGDSGAYFLGFLLAILVVRLRPEGLPPAQAITIALLLCALPIADLCYVVIRRVGKGIHPFTAGRDHLSHTLQRRRLSVPIAVLVLMTFAVLTSSLAVLLAIVAFP